MKYIPILFSTAMVQALLAGRKTMTRRTKGLENLENHYYQSLVNHATGKFTFVENGNYSPKNEDVKIIKCPFGEIGDVLWVREKSCYVMREHASDLLEGFRENRQTIYGTDFHNDWMIHAKEKYGYKWTPSIFMPKETCRIFLKITDIRVERLQDISEEASIAEGIEIAYYNNEVVKFDGKTCYKLKSNEVTANPIQVFEFLWESINGKDSWHANPWVWVIKFEQIDKPEDFK